MQSYGPLVCPLPVYAVPSLPSLSPLSAYMTTLAMWSGMGARRGLPSYPVDVEQTYVRSTHQILTDTDQDLLAQTADGGEQGPCYIIVQQR